MRIQLVAVAKKAGSVLETIKNNVGDKAFMAIMMKCEKGYGSVKDYLARYADRVVPTPEEFVELFGIEDEDKKGLDAEGLLLDRLENNESWGELQVGLAYSTKLLADYPKIKEKLIQVATTSSCGYDT